MPTFVIVNKSRGIVWTGEAQSVRDVLDKVSLSEYIQANGDSVTVMPASSVQSVKVI